MFPMSALTCDADDSRTPRCLTLSDGDAAVVGMGLLQGRVLVCRLHVRVIVKGFGSSPFGLF